MESHLLKQICVKDLILTYYSLCQSVYTHCEFVLKLGQWVL